MLRFICCDPICEIDTIPEGLVRLSIVVSDIRWVYHLGCLLLCPRALLHLLDGLYVIVLVTGHIY